MSNVRDFGAAGDGRMDDAEAIQHAITDGDGTLEFPPGVYRLSRTVEIPLDRHGPCGLIGQGNAKIVMTGQGPAFRLIGTHGGTGDPTSVKPNVWTKQRMPTIANLEIEGDHAEADGLQLQGTMQAVVSGVLIRKCRHGIHLFQRNRNVIITGCQIYHNTGVGVFLDRLNLHQINIVGSHISYNRMGGIRIEQSEVRNLQITGNDIEYNNFRVHGTDPEPTAEIWIDTTVEKASVNEVTIGSNTIQATESPGGANIRILEKSDGSRPPGLITITGNVIGSQENNVHLSGCYGVTLTGNTIYSAIQRNLLLEDCRLMTITGNVFRRHTPQYGTGVRLVRSSECTIQGCVFHDEAEGGQTSGASLLEIEECRNVLVGGSQFHNGVPFGIDVKDSERVQISNCNVEDTRQPPVSKGTIRFAGTGQQNEIRHCLLDNGTGKPGIDLADSAGVTIS